MSFVMSIFMISLIIYGLLPAAHTVVTINRSPYRDYLDTLHSPLNAYRSVKAYDKLKLLHPVVYSKGILKYPKHWSVGKLKATMYLGDHFHRDKNNGVNEWLIDNERIKFTEPVFGPDNYYSSDQLQGHEHSDIKPVVEHIEDDLKYDFRTKTHSYSR